MSKTRFVLWVLGILIFAAVIGYLIIGYILKPKKALLRVEATPDSTVFINGNEIGKTPLSIELKEEEISIKLVPLAPETPLIPYEGRVKLTEGVETIVRRKLGETREASSGETVSFERLNSKEANIASISIPDGVEVILDGTSRNSTPAKFESVSPGQHLLAFNAPGYISKEIKVLAETGYTLTVIAELEKDPNPPLPPKLEEELEESQKEVVEILETPVGFLRVRSGPSTDNPEIGRAEPGETYELIEIDEDSGWFKILLDGQEGWVTDEYASISAETN